MCCNRILGVTFPSGLSFQQIARNSAKIDFGNTGLSDYENSDFYANHATD